LFNWIDWLIIDWFIIDWLIIHPFSSLFIPIIVKPSAPVLVFSTVWSRNLLTSDHILLTCPYFRIVFRSSLGEIYALQPGLVFIHDMWGDRRHRCIQPSHRKIWDIIVLSLGLPGTSPMPVYSTIGKWKQN